MRRMREKHIRIKIIRTGTIRNEIIRTEIIQNGRNMHIRIRPIRHSLTVEKKQMVFWRSFRTDMDLFAVQIISQVKMIFMYHRLRYAGSI